MKKIISIFIILILFPTYGLAVGIKKIDSNWMPYYYFHKEQSKLPELLQDITYSYYLAKDTHAMDRTIAFLATIFKKNPDIIDSIVDLRIDDKMTEAVNLALWVAGEKWRVTQILNKTPKWVERTAPVLSEMKIEKSGDLDFMWGAFMASGNALYINKIIDTLDKNKQLTDSKIVNRKIRKYARLSLGRNITRYELVNRIVRKRLKTANVGLINEIDALVKRYNNKKPAFPSANKQFSAQLVVVDSSVLSKFGSSSAKDLFIAQNKAIKKGDKVVVKIVFSGMELDKDFKADVTFNMIIKDPDGNLVYGDNLQNEVAIKRKLPVRFNVFNDSNNLIMILEDGDKSGFYDINAVVRDNVSGKEVTINKIIEVI